MSTINFQLARWVLTLTARGSTYQMYAPHLLQPEFADKSRKIAPHPIYNSKMAADLTNNITIHKILSSNQRQTLQCLLDLRKDDSREEK